MNTTHSHTTSQLSHTYLKGRIMHRGRMIHCTLLAAGLLIGLLAPAAQSAVVFSDDFDTGETVGNTPSNWTDSSDTNQSVTVSDEQSVSSPNSMFFDDTSTVANGAAIADTTFTSTSTASGDIVEWEFSWRENNDNAFGGMLRARLQDASGTDGLLVLTTADGDAGFDLSYRGPSTSTPPDNDTVIDTISEDTWNTIRVVADMTAETADVYLNDILKATGLNFSVNAQ